ncbi:integral membrane protein, partial [Streptomyces zinciresistens K42]
MLVLPALGLYRWVPAPAGRVLAVVGGEAGDALGHAWRIAGRLSLAVGRFLAGLLRRTLAEPASWAYRTVLP